MGLIREKPILSQSYQDLMAVAVKTTHIQELSLLLWVSYFSSQKSVQLGDSLGLAALARRTGGSYGQEDLYRVSPGAPVMVFPASLDTHCKQSLVLLSHCASIITMCFT